MGATRNQDRLIDLCLDRPAGPLYTDAREKHATHFDRSVRHGSDYHTGDSLVQLLPYDGGFMGQAGLDLRLFKYKGKWKVLHVAQWIS